MSPFLCFVSCSLTHQLLLFFWMTRKTFLTRGCLLRSQLILPMPVSFNASLNTPPPNILNYKYINNPWSLGPKLCVFKHYSITVPLCWWYCMNALGNKGKGDCCTFCPALLSHTSLKTHLIYWTFVRQLFMGQYFLIFSNIS